VVSSFTAVRRANGVRLRWRTAQKANLLGFDVLRNGRKLNGHLLPATAQTYLDRSAVRTRAYAYRLRAVALGGSHRSSWLARVP
jgi:hypothetical protein